MIFVKDEWLLAIHSLTEIPVVQLVAAEQLGSVAGRPTLVPPDQHPRYADLIDLSSLDADMVDAFERIEKCRDALAVKSDDYKL